MSGFFGAVSAPSIKEWTKEALEKLLDESIEELDDTRNDKDLSLQDKLRWGMVAESLMVLRELARRLEQSVPK